MGRDQCGPNGPSMAREVDVDEFVRVLAPQQRMEVQAALDPGRRHGAVPQRTWERGGGGQLRDP
jgi:hypothetical protein